MLNIELPVLKSEDLNRFDEAPLRIEVGNGLSCVHLHLTRQLEDHEEANLVAGNMLRNTYRELVAMGIRPLVQLNSLRYGIPGNISDNSMFVNTVKGIGDWGYALDVPVATCDVYFDTRYAKNPVINIIVTGIIETSIQLQQKKIESGQFLYIITPDINRPQGSMPVYKEKLLMEATQKGFKTGIIKGMWSTGDLGLLHTIALISVKYKTGFEIKLKELFDCTNDELSPSEIINSFENNIIFTVNKKDVKEIEKIFSERDVKIKNIGIVTEEQYLKITDKNKDTISLDLSALKIRKEVKQKHKIKVAIEQDKTHDEFSIDNIADINDTKELKKVAFDLLGRLNVCSKDWIYQQYDAMSGTPEIFSNVPTDATVINLKNERVSFLVSVEGNPIYLRANYDAGIAIAVAEASRKIICSGGIPLAITNCCNYFKDEVKDKTSKATFSNDNISSAIERLNITSINNSARLICKNSVNINSIISEPSICLTGVMEDKNNLITMGFKEKGDLIFLIGECKNDLSSSQYLVHHHNIISSNAPALDIEEEALVQEVLTELICNKVLSSAHSVSKGGLFVALAESGFQNNLGFDITTDCEIRTDAYLFGESQSRALVSVSPDNEAVFIDYLVSIGISFTLLGHVTKGSFRINDEPFGCVSEASNIYFNTLSESLSPYIN